MKQKKRLLVQKERNHNWKEVYKLRKFYLIILVTDLIFIFILTSINLINRSVDAVSKTEKIFSFEDNELLGVKLSMDKEQVEKILGKPKKIESHYEGAFDADVLNYYYDFGEIRLEPYDNEKHLVSSIYTNKQNSRGPRNIKVGDRMETVLKKFPYDKNAIIEKEGETQVKYVYGRLHDDKYKLDGNSGSIKYDEKGNVIAITYKYEYYFLHMEIKEGRIKTIALFAHNN